MATTILQKRGTAADWASSDPILLAGEFGYETDTGVLKVGDGATSWTFLGNLFVVNPTYAISSSTATVDEGTAVTFTLTTTGIPENTLLYWVTSGTNITEQDFTDNTLSGTVLINSNTGTIVRTLFEDDSTEGSEIFDIEIRQGSISGPILLATGNGGETTINDTSLDPPPTGQIQYATSGTYSWVAPEGVTSVSAVLIGGGGGGGGSTAYGGFPGGGGGGGALAWKNNIAVTPGNSYSVVVGIGGAGSNGTGANGGSSTFLGVSAGGGNGGDHGSSGSVTNPGGTRAGADGGGNGGAGGYGGQFSGYSNGYGGGGGGAGGYSGNGGAGAIRSYAGNPTNGGPGVGGAGAGGGGTGNGGSVGLQGQGANGVPNGGHGSSTGTVFGGGGGGRNANGYPSPGLNGVGGGVRIIWGANRAFPDTNTGDL